MNTNSKDGSIGSLFAESKPNTIYKSVLEKSMDEKSFNDPYESMIRTVSNVDHAYFGDLSSVLLYEEISCKVNKGSTHLIGSPLLDQP